MLLLNLVITKTNQKKGEKKKGKKEEGPIKQSNENIFFYISFFFFTQNIWKTNNDVQDLRVSFFPLPIPLYLSMIWLRSPLMTTAKA